ncbi:sarcosine oxidase subunit delta [Aestuariivita boseongensis]|uniref:sarcosine oxidase subunit delta n=1 Tax=Aestuariivita boseongensis TaxID=1470562 RepID=UPI00067FB7F5|nr:sarcosine oxidase subunit delta [Aestuariivita boseongensis]
MRITCPICGERDSREFSYRGADVALHRPDPEAGEAAWDDYVHLRDNPAGETRDMWYHEGGCGAWIVVTRNTVTHEVIGSELAAEVAR